MSIPTLAEYQDAIQNPSLCFRDRELKNGQPLLNSLGLPSPITGGFASVYQINTGTARYAVRCFLREYDDQNSRYEIIHGFLRSISLPSYLIDFDYQPKGILVNGRWLPILKMQWLQGQSLNSYIESNLNNQAALQSLAENWVTLVRSLKSIGIAHGDLQHGNVLVCNGQLKLIDYDGMFVPALAGQGSHETGHPSYQHPRRSGQDFHAEIDNFAAIAIHVAILAVKCEPNLWWQFNNDDNILFRREDFVNPSQSRVFATLFRLTDREIVRRAMALHQACSNAVNRIPDIEIKNFNSNVPDWVLDQILISVEEVRVNRFAFAFKLLWKRPGLGYINIIEQVPVYQTQTRTVIKTRMVTKEITVKQKMANVPFFLLDKIFGNYYIDVIKRYQEPEQYQDVETDTIMVGTRNVESRESRHFDGHNGSVISVTFSNDSSLLLSGSLDGSGIIWRCDTGERLTNLNSHDREISGVATVGDFFATSSFDRTIRLWNRSGQKIRTFESQNSRLYSVASNADGSLIAGGIGRLQVWLWNVSNVSSDNEIHRFSGHTRIVCSVAFSPDSSFIVSGSLDLSVRVWSVRQKECKFVLYGHTDVVNIVAVSPDGKLIASGGNDGKIFIWDIKSGGQLMKINAKAPKVYALVFSPDSQHVISGGSDCIIRCWDINSGLEIGQRDGHSEAIRGLAISTDGNKLASCGDDRVVMLWTLT